MLTSSPRPFGRRHLRRVVTSLLAGAALVAGTADALADAAPAARTALAPVIGTAGQGGAVIVWLTDQHASLNLSTQGAARTAAAHADQKPIVAAIEAAGGTDILQLVSVNAVAAHVSATAVQQLRALAAVKQIVPDSTVTVGDPETTGPADTQARTVPDRTDASGRRKDSDAGPSDVNPFPNSNDCGTQDQPLIEPEADAVINAPAMTNAGLETESGHGVIVANDGISEAPDLDLVGNPNFVRPAADGGGSVVVGATPGDSTDATDGEYYGDASSIDAQGAVVYQYSKELPYSGLPEDCYFKLVGDAPGASLVDTDSITTPESAAGDPATTTESKIVAGIDAAVIRYHADVINESYGYSNAPGSYAAHYAANDAAVAAGVTVVASSGDSGASGTVSSPATDPLIIAAGATNTLRENAMAYGFTGWVNNDITPLSSGGTSPNNKLVDLVAPGYGGEAACNPNGSDCPTNTQTEAFGGTSEASPLIAGAAADVIQAFRDSHDGDSPSPALVKQLLTGTATDVDAPADQQGAGLVDIGAAVAAAQQTANTTLPGAATPSLIPSATQLDLAGAGGSTTNRTVDLYNPSNVSTTVTGTYRQLGPETQIGSTVTENVSAPDPAAPVPSDGAQAAPDISFDVPVGLDRLDADMIWPDAKNGTILNFVLTDPQGRLRQISYDYGSASATTIGSVPNIQHVEVAGPEPGTWKVQIKWANGRAHLQEPPNAPGTYTGPVQFKVAGQEWVTSPASGPVTVKAHSSATIPLAVDFPAAPGDHPQSVQFTADNGGATSLPIARRTLVPSTGGEFDTAITGTVGRGIGQITSYNVDVAAGQPDLGITLTTPDASTDNPMSVYLINPSGVSVAMHTVTSGNPPRSRTVNGVPLTPSADGSDQSATFHVAGPAAGRWEIDVALNLTVSGKEFTQTVTGDVLPQAPTITSPLDSSNATTRTPTVSGTGTSGDTVTVVDGSGNPVCSSVVTDGTWACAPTTALAAGSLTLSATQADATGDPSLASAPVTVTIPSTGTVALTLDPAAPHLGQGVTLTATTTGVPDATIVTFADATTVLGTAAVTGDVATLAVPTGFGVGSHPLTASVAATDTTLAVVSPAVDVLISKTASTIALKLSKSTVTYGHAVTGRITVGGATGGTATVTYGAGPKSVAVSAAGTATFTIPATLAARQHVVGAVYDGTATVAASGRATTTLTVVKARTATSLALSATRVEHGHSEWITVRVSGHAGGLYPAGTITVHAAIGARRTTRTITLHQPRRGVLSFTITLPNRAGSARVYAHFGGNGDFLASTSATRTVRLT